MKVGMYNRWLATMGGGEMYSLSIAEILSQHHEVQVISHTPVSREDAARRLNLKLENVEFVTIPSCTNEELKPLTGQYDFFINASFMDYIPSIAPHSANIVFFPTPLGGLQTSRLRYRLGWAIKRWFMLPTLAEGYQRSASFPGHPFTVVLTAPIRIKLPASAKPYPVSLTLVNIEAQTETVRTRLDGQPLWGATAIAPGQSAPFHFEVPGSNKPVHELVIELDGSDQERLSSPCLGLAGLTVHTPPFQFFQSIFGNKLRHYGLRFQLLPLPNSSFQEYLDTYDALWSISVYTQSWVRKYWNRDSSILFPPVDVQKFHPAPKTRKILNVGRFFAGAHNKKHLEMIRAFRAMVDGGLKDWELYLVGGSRSGDIHQKYLADVISAAGGYPIHVLPDLPYSELVPLYNESSIYWHASGFGEDENRDPIKFEHFGITTVEAMAAGCVPVVIGKGGQPEIVQHGKNGFLWDSLEKLQE